MRVGFTLYGSTALLPIFLQTMLGYTALLSGLVLSPGGIAMMIGMLIVGRLLGRFQARWLIVFGLRGGGDRDCSGCRDSTSTSTSAPRCGRARFRRWAWRFCSCRSTRRRSASVKPEKLGYATGLMNLFRNIGGSAGIAMITTMLARRQQFHQEVLVSHLTPLDGGVLPTLNGMAANLVAHGATGSDAAVQALGQLYGLVQRQAAMLAVADTFWVLALVFLSMIPLVVCLRMTPLHKGPMVME